ncbi:MAG: hypothetical protein HN576_12065 [Bacteriovoracaceae bacterium]|jgi:hypothetical protein|nr:hypothetical protein [Bacteriovoracaceae bacterium]
MKKVLGGALFCGLLFSLTFTVISNEEASQTKGELISLPRIQKGSPGNLRVGFSEVKITPKIVDTWIDVDGDARYKRRKDKYIDGNGNGKFDPIYLAGFQQGRPATGIHDDIWALTTVIDNGKTRIAICAIDSIGFFHNDLEDVRAKLKKEWKIDYLMVAATHNHGVPDLQGIWGNLLKSGINKKYLQKVKDDIVSSVGLAVGNMAPSKMEVRRITLRPKEYEDMIADTRLPEVYDPDLRVIRFVDPESDATQGSIITWANHPETLWSGNLEITSDYPGHLRRGLSQGILYDGKSYRSGIGGTHLFIVAALGGLLAPHRRLAVHDPFINETFQKPSFEKARAIGYRLADKILEDFDSNQVEQIYQPEIRLVAKKFRVRIKNWRFRLARILRILKRRFVGWFKIKTEVALLDIGPARILTIPGEIYPEIVNGGIEAPEGQDFKIEPLEIPPIREAMGERINFIFGQTNDALGYIIPKSQWDAKSPYTYGREKRPYGEVNSIGHHFAPLLHSEVLGLIEKLERAKRSH